ncbi:MAG: hypothetical protein CM15mV44_0490 [uncultured marine virus]|nr:MAG: hypothetical protein CM15mV44_0490 [uncultured marine virus]
MGMDVYGRQKGKYFRNNVWWWRRLWDFVAHIDELYSEVKKTNRLISEDMYHSGHCNDGVGLETQEDCDELLNRLGWAIEEGLAHAKEREVKKEIEKAEQHNKLIEKQREDFRAKMKKKLGKKVPPIEYPKEDFKEWEKIHLQEDYNAHYPFSVENVEEFCEFLKNCGGFAIH